MAIILAAILSVSAVYFGALLAFSGASMGAEDSLPPATRDCKTVGSPKWNRLVRLERKIDGHSAHRTRSGPICVKIYRDFKRHVDRLKRVNCWHRSVRCWIINAAKKYHQPVGDALRVAYCESSFDPHNSYAGHYGLFQFLPSTFATTPYRNRNIWSPKWNSLAAMWMWSVGRRNEWACQ